jgi:hypothetical protein
VAFRVVIGIPLKARGCISNQGSFALELPARPC